MYLILFFCIHRGKRTTAHVGPITALAWRPPPLSSSPSAEQELLASASRASSETLFPSVLAYSIVHYTPLLLNQPINPPTTHHTQQDKSVKCWDLRAKNIGDCARLLEGMPHAALSLAWLPGGAEQTFAMGALG